MDGLGMNVLDQGSLDALRSLQDEGDDGLLGELIDLFLHDAPIRVASIGDALALEDWTAALATAHSLRGSCGSLGALHMADLCGRLERHLRTGGDRHGAEDIFRELESQAVLVQEALERERR